MSKLEHLKTVRKRVAPVVLLLIIISGIVYYIMGREVSYTGIAEAVVTTSPSEVSGKIVESNVTLGQEVNAGYVIAVIDSSDLEYALEQLELNLEKAQISSADAKTGQSARAQSGIAAAQAAYSGAAAAADKANQDYQSALALYRDSAISESSLQESKLKADKAVSDLAAARAQLDIARNSSVSSVSESSNVEMLLLESKIAQQKDMIEKCIVKANADGTVISKNYGLGDFVAPGYDLADISSSSEKYLVMYYPKDSLADISYGEVIPFVYNGAEYAGIVKFIDVKPQYTPQDFQTQANKNKESVKVKLLIPEDCTIKPGETAKIPAFDR
ncbi:MAG: biotin/lipoyl-binding protein [Clostridiales bacterium]|nr:biotin/lipoyl-binding protein [Clostridiales bacterium]